ncbi:hypothetical protein [Glaciimonas immobilis]|uniref:Uncharacterized protein n=1 Tax=Glaciimonas immobilis TaxID=728004 RepID=A0A840RTX3_9BURK|nr:hypothetical protein [Glaciimonas immobilis]KAF3997066.1 hypothetical protein HAV38_15475 [Glaciimonas immobilis]MBB5199919.1 hypothetical protein [Glaciimonas immobilis]
MQNPIQNKKLLKKILPLMIALATFGATQSVLAVDVARDARGQIKAIKATSNEQNYLDGLTVEVTQKAMANGGTEVLAEAVNTMSASPVPLRFRWFVPQNAVVENPDLSKTAGMAFNMPAEKDRNYDATLIATVLNGDASPLMRIINVTITPVGSTQAYLNGLTVDTVQKKGFDGSVELTIKAGNEEKSASPAPVKYSWWVATDNNVSTNQKTDIPEAHFTIPASQQKNYKVYVLASDARDNGSIIITRSLTVTPQGSTQEWVKGLTFDSTQTLQPDGSVEVKITHGNKYQPHSPTPVQYYWLADPLAIPGSMNPPKGQLLDLPELKFTMPAGQRVPYSAFVSASDVDDENVKAAHLVTINPQLSPKATAKK